VTLTSHPLLVSLVMKE